MNEPAVNVGDTFRTDANEYTVLSVEGNRATVRVKVPSYRVRIDKEGGGTVPVWEKSLHVRTLADMDR